MTGAATLLGGVSMGLLRNAGAQATFGAGAILALVAAIALACRRSVAPRSDAA